MQHPYSTLQKQIAFRLMDWDFEYTATDMPAQERHWGEAIESAAAEVLSGCEETARAACLEKPQVPPDADAQVPSAIE